MSTHPNVILLARLRPDDLARKTMREILAESGEEMTGDCDSIEIGGEDYWADVLESDYDENSQISGEPGDLVFFDFVTYGYGVSIAWDDLASRKEKLSEWARGVCERHHCTFSIEVTANYY